MGSPGLLLFCSAVILENQQKILSFSKNYMKPTETSILFASQGLIMIIIIIIIIIITNIYTG